MINSLRRLLPITRIYVAEIRLSFDYMHLPFFLFCIYIEKDITLISAGKYAWSVKAAKDMLFRNRLSLFIPSQYS